ncbi:MAG: hypothetical protein AAB975_01940, partial [Patescibacteria group bacterium]
SLRKRNVATPTPGMLLSALRKISSVEFTYVSILEDEWCWQIISFCPHPYHTPNLAPLSGGE